MVTRMDGYNRGLGRRSWPWIGLGILLVIGSVEYHVVRSDDRTQNETVPDVVRFVLEIPKLRKTSYPESDSTVNAVVKTYYRATGNLMNQLRDRRLSTDYYILKELPVERSELRSRLMVTVIREVEGKKYGRVRLENLIAKQEKIAAKKRLQLLLKYFE